MSNCEAQVKLSHFVRRVQKMDQSTFTLTNTIVLYNRLCQAEIAKRTLHLARSLLQSNENKSTSIYQLVSQLPLPEDYAQQELRFIVNMHVNEIIC